MYFRNFGYAFSSAFMSAWSSAASCQRLKSSLTLNALGVGVCAIFARAGRATVGLACV